MSIRIPTSAYYDLYPGDYVLVALPSGRVQGISKVAGGFDNLAELMIKGETASHYLVARVGVDSEAYVCRKIIVTPTSKSITVIIPPGPAA
jgi:hypothetical protein